MSQSYPPWASAPPPPPPPRQGMQQWLRWVIALGVALVLIVVILVGVVVARGREPDDGGDGSGNGSAAASADPAPQVDPGPFETLADYESQDLSWEGCDDDLECAGLVVPVDYGKPRGESITLKLQRAAALDGDAPARSLVVNPGGPGAPGTSMTENANAFFGQPLRDHFDIVAFDPRGTGASDPIDCLSDEDLDAFIAEDPSPDTDAEIDDFAQGQEDFFSGCVEDSDDLVGHVSTVEAARDMDVLRAALDEDQLTYLGFSYGTTLGSTYAQLFPDRVGQFVLDGATDPTLDSRADALSQAGGFERALRSYVGACVDAGECFLGADVDAGIATIQGLIAQVEEQPLTTQLDRELQVGNAFYGLVAPLYNQESWPQLDQALQQALAGDGTLLLAFSDIYSSRDTVNGGYTDNSFEALPAISCLDDPTAIDPSEVPAQIPDFEEVSPTFGAVFAWGLAGCDGIEVTASEPTPRIRARGAAPIVVVGTTRDPATPYEEAVALAGQLDSGVLVSRDGDGHTAYNQGNSCIDEALESYLIDDVVPENGLKC